MASESEIIESKAQPYAKKLLFVILFLCIVLYVYPLLGMLRLPLAYCFPFAVGYAIYLVIALYRLGTSPLPIVPLVSVWSLIIIGIAFDVLITIIINPSLSMETNLVARVLLDSGNSLEFVYIYGFVAQSLLVVFACLMWATFLRHRQTIVDLAWQLNPKTAKEFMLAAFRGKTRWEWFYGWRPSDYKDYKWFRILQWFFWLSAMHGLLRLYFGLRWLGLRLPQNVLMVLYLLLITVPYFFWLRLQFSKGNTLEQRAQAHGVEQT